MLPGSLSQIEIERSKDDLHIIYHVLFYICRNSTAAQIIWNMFQKDNKSWKQFTAYMKVKSGHGQKTVPLLEMGNGVSDGILHHLCTDYIYFMHYLQDFIMTAMRQECGSGT